MLFPELGKLIFERLTLVPVHGQIGDDGFDGVGYMKDAILLNKLERDHHMVSNSTTKSREHYITDRGSLFQSGQQTKTVSKYSPVPAVSW